MTPGIIQSVIDKAIQKLEKEIEKSDSIYDDYIIGIREVNQDSMVALRLGRVALNEKLTELKELKAELIDRIRQAIPTFGRDLSRMQIYTLLGLLGTEKEDET